MVNFFWSDHFLISFFVARYLLPSGSSARTLRRGRQAELYGGDGVDGWDHTHTRGSKNQPHPHPHPHPFLIFGPHPHPHPHFTVKVLTAPASAPAP